MRAHERVPGAAGSVRANIGNDLDGTDGPLAQHYRDHSRVTHN